MGELIWDSGYRGKEVCHARQSRHWTDMAARAGSWEITYSNSSLRQERANRKWYFCLLQQGCSSFFHQGCSSSLEQAWSSSIFPKRQQLGTKSSMSESLRDICHSILHNFHGYVYTFRVIHANIMWICMCILHIIQKQLFSFCSAGGH